MLNVSCKRVVLGFSDTSTERYTLPHKQRSGRFGIYDTESFKVNGEHVLDDVLLVKLGMSVSELKLPILVYC